MAKDLVSRPRIRPKTWDQGCCFLSAMCFKDEEKSSMTHHWLKPTNEIDCSTHLFQLIRTDVGTVREAKVDQSPLANVVGALPGNTSVVHKIPRSTNRCFAEWPCPLFLSSCQSQMTFVNQSIDQSIHKFTRCTLKSKSHEKNNMG